MFGNVYLKDLRTRLSDDPLIKRNNIRNWALTTADNCLEMFSNYIDKSMRVSPSF